MLAFMVYVLLASSLSIRIEKTLQFSQMRKHHGWYVMGGIYLGQGIVQVSSKIQLSSGLAEQKAYRFQLLMVNQTHMQMDKDLHCSINGNSIFHSLLLNRSQTSYSQHINTQMSFIGEQFMFIIIRDCQLSLLKQYFQRNAYIKIELIFNKNQISLRSILQISVLIISSLSYCYFIYLIRKCVDGEENRKIVRYISNYVYLNAIIVLFKQTIVIASFLNYSQFLLEASVIFLQSLAEALINFILINIALGWTLTTEAEIFLQSYWSKFLSFIIKQTTAFFFFLDGNNILQQNWRGIWQVALTGAIYSLQLILIIKKMRIGDVRQKRLFKYIVMIVVLRAICTPLLSLIVDRNTLLASKQLAQLLVMVGQLLINAILINIFMGASSQHYKLCITNRSFMD